MVEEKASNFTGDLTTLNTTIEATEAPTSLELRQFLNSQDWGTPENLKNFVDVVQQGFELLKSFNTTGLFSSESIEELGVFRSQFIFLTCIVIGILVLYLLQCWTCVCVQKTRKSGKKHYQNLQDDFKLPMRTMRSQNG